MVVILYLDFSLGSHARVFEYGRFLVAFLFPPLFLGLMAILDPLSGHVVCVDWSCFCFALVIFCRTQRTNVSGYILPSMISLPELISLWINYFVVFSGFFFICVLRLFRLCCRKNLFGTNCSGVMSAPVSMPSFGLGNKIG